MRFLLLVAFCGWIFLPGLALGAAESAQEVHAVVQRLAAAREVLAAHPPAPGAPRADAELYVLSEVLAAGGATARADAARRYLLDFLKASPLVALVPPVPAGIMPLEDFDPDPDLARLWLAGLASAAPDDLGATSEAWADWFSLARAAARSPRDLLSAETAVDFLRRSPRSPWAGWAALQLLWRTWLADPDHADGTAFAGFAARHPNHPLAAEARAAADLPRFFPRLMAWRSALVPGWGETRWNRA